MTDNSTEKYLITLLRCAIESRPAPEADSAEPSEVLKLAQYHSVANLAYYAAEALDLPVALRKEWSELRDREIMHDIRQMTEFSLLCDALDKGGIRFLPLKGAILKELYPQSDYRSMSDIDILIDPENAKKVRELMLSLGYETESLEYGIHDVYTKKPSVSIEIHRALFADDGREFVPIFKDIWSHCDADGCFYRLQPDYFLAFLLAHGMKHYQLGGTGVRTFLDLHIYRQRHPGLDTDAVCALFKESGSEKLCGDFLALAEMWFGNGEETPELRKMAEYVLRGGTYGTLENQVEYELQSKSKAKYILSKLFPTMSHLKQQYPVLRKAPYLVPFVWIYRLVTKPFVNWKLHKVKMKTLAKK